jgi:hypothetical protein
MARTIRKPVARKLANSEPDQMETGELVALSRLNPYYKNPRKGDVEKVAESLKAHGQIKPIGVNRGTITGRPNEILFGNHTFKAAKSLRWTKIWVKWFDVDEPTATKIVLADNGTSDGSTYDDSILTELLMGLKDSGESLIGTTYTDNVLERLVKTMDAGPNANVDMIEDADDTLEGVADLNNYPFFPSDAPYEIPQLLDHMIPDRLPGELDVWAGHEVDLDRQEENPDLWWLAQWHSGMRGVNWEQCVAMFYTEDFHFDSVFTEPAKNTKKILNLGMKYAIMPNYSVNPDWPIATWIWAAYRSFYVGRYFQEAGIQVIPDIQYGTRDEALDITLVGIPEDAGVVSAQIQNARGDMTKIRTVARLLKECEDRLAFRNIIIYGHTDADRVLDRADLSANIIRVSNRSERRREYLNSGSTINSQKVKSSGRRRKKVNNDPE